MFTGDHIFVHIKEFIGQFALVANPVFTKHAHRPDSLRMSFHLLMLDRSKTADFKEFLPSKKPLPFHRMVELLKMSEIDYKNVFYSETLLGEVKKSW